MEDVCRGTWVRGSPGNHEAQQVCFLSGPQSNLQTIFKCQGSNAKSISVQDGRLWPHLYLKFLDNKIVQNKEPIKEIIKGFFRGAKGKV